MPFCHKCGTYVESGDTCPQCGASLHALHQAPPADGPQNQQPGAPPQYYGQGQPPYGGQGMGHAPGGYGAPPPKNKFPVWIFVMVGIVVGVAFAGLMIAIAVPIYMNARSNAQRRTCQANMRTIDGAIQSYEAMFDTPGTYPTSLEDMTQPETKTLKSIPTCPSGDKSYIWVDGAPPYVSCPNVSSHTI
ncbi:MAG: hypothetical protein JW738_09195 [Actinobacteria bacterium]|nr:hypothetical protein [Actinomycetota bacterium]